jgi:hypothetical protein
VTSPAFFPSERAVRTTDSTVEVFRTRQSWQLVRHYRSSEQQVSARRPRARGECDGDGCWEYARSGYNHPLRRPSRVFQLWARVVVRPSRIARGGLSLLTLAMEIRLLQNLRRMERLAAGALLDLLFVRREIQHYWISPKTARVADVQPWNQQSSPCTLVFKY